MADVGRCASYPYTPGHELAGVVTQVGNRVKRFKIGDHIGVGCFIDSCLNCEQCKNGCGHKCIDQVSTYNDFDCGTGRAETYPKGQRTIGGYSTHMVVNEQFAIQVPEDYPLACVGPVMCAGITMYDPLKAHGAKKGTRVAIVGLGGLGVMGIKLAKALGCTVTAISRSKKKEEFAMSNGADAFLISSDENALAKAEKSFDLILNTIPSDHDWTIYQKLVVDDTGTHVLLGLTKAMAAALYLDKDNIKSSLYGGIQNTQEVMDLCAREDIRPEIEVVPVQFISSIFELLDKSNDECKRYVLDIKGSLTEDCLQEWVSCPPVLGPNPTGFTKFGVVMELTRMALFW